MRMAPVGILCSDGVVMASDSAGALSIGFQPTIGQQEVTKIAALRDLRGEVGRGDRVCGHRAS